MAPAYSCPKCGYTTDHVGNYKHINKYSKCEPKEVEECSLNGKQCKVRGSTLRKHVCLADILLEAFEDQYTLFDTVCLELKSMPHNDFQQLGLASHQSEDVALAALSCFTSTQSTRSIKILHHANTTAASSQLSYQSSESKKAATRKASGQICGTRFQRLRCSMV